MRGSAGDGDGEGGVGVAEGEVGAVVVVRVGEEPDQGRQDCDCLGDAEGEVEEELDGSE